MLIAVITLPSSRVDVLSQQLKILGGRIILVARNVFHAVFKSRCCQKHYLFQLSLCTVVCSTHTDIHLVWQLVYITLLLTSVVFFKRFCCSVRTAGREASLTCLEVNPLKQEFFIFFFFFFWPQTPLRVLPKLQVASYKNELKCIQYKTVKIKL